MRPRLKQSCSLFGRHFAIALVFATSLIVASGLTASPVAAQEISDEHLAAARAAVAASKTTRQLDAILPQIGESLKERLISGRPDVADQISTIVDDATLSLAPRRGDLETEIARSYARIFTIEELTVISEFYNTETGKKLIEQLPLIGRLMTEASRVWSAGLQRDMGVLVSQKLQEADLQ